ncbi:MAG: hypothetical protein IT330_01725 [Anaerolineae bacterium]|nr:hypothetical protein [Anaerolineae bacterium]
MPSSLSARGATLLLLTCILLLLLSSPPAAATTPAAPAAPAVQNPGLECSQGYDAQAGLSGLIPRGWTARLLNGAPTLHSARIFFTGGCHNSNWVEHLEGADALVFLAQDIETPPLPGKPFDAVIYQRVATTPGTAYSLSAWMVSLCGGSFNNPNDCPPGYYMAKMLGIDPLGGTNPLAASVVWMEDRRNFNESRWANLRLAATAQSATITLFVRINSPFRWHGNHAFADAISLVRAPTAYFVGLPARARNQATIRWNGAQSPDVLAIPGGTYQLRFDVQFRVGDDGPWQDWRTDQPAGSALFQVDTHVRRIYFRVRARAEQPPDSGGVFPNHRYPGVWSVPALITFNVSPRTYLPLARLRR